MIKILVKIMQKHRYLALVGMRLVQIIGKHPYRIHPKHLISQTPWYLRYIKKTDMVLDFGCGNGQHSLKIAKICKSTTAFDNDRKSLDLAINEARRKGIENIKFLKHDGERKLPFKTNEFDCVLFIDVLEHLKNRNQALSEIHRVLKKEGNLLITVPNVDTSWKKLQKKHGLFYYTDPDHKIEFTRQQIENLLKIKNFTIKKVALGMWDTPLSGLIDMIGGISLSFYKRLKKIRISYVKKHPAEADGFDIVAVKK